MKYIPLLFLLCACSSNFYCRKCLEVRPTKTDTVYQQFFVDVPSVSTDSVFVSVPGDTVRITKDRLRVEYVRIPGKKDSVWIYGHCLPDTLRIEVPTLVTNEIRTGIPVLRVWLICGGLVILALVIGAFIGKIIK